MQIEKFQMSQKLRIEHQVLDKNAKVIYLRDKYRRPVGCIVYRETWHDTFCRIDYGYSSLARVDQHGKLKVVVDGSTLFYSRKGMISPSKLDGRDKAYLSLEKRLEKSGSIDIFLNQQNVRVTKSGTKILLKEAILQSLLDNSVGSETFRSRIHDHMKYINLGAKWTRNPWVLLPSKLKNDLVTKYGANLQKALESLLHSDQAETTTD